MVTVTHTGVTPFKFGLTNEKGAIFNLEKFLCCKLTHLNDWSKAGSLCPFMLYALFTNVYGIK